jgi:hypothetical protein
LSSNTKVSANLLGAQTLEQMLEAVPQLGQYDSLEAVPVLAVYDRLSRGWLTVAVLWLAMITMLLLLMATVIIVLFLLGDLIVLRLTPITDQWIGTANVPLLQLLRTAASMAIVFFAFKAGPRRWLVSSTDKFKRRIRLRLVLLQAITLQLERNRRLVDSNWRRAVCKNCLARLDRYTVRFAYWRWIRFARCRKCFDDQSCYTRVSTIAGWLDHEMNASQEQAGEVVKVNLLHRLPPRSLPLPIDLEELVIADVEDEDVETLIFLYRSQQPKTDLPKPKRLRCRLTRNSTVSPISRRQLKQNFSLLT